MDKHDLAEETRRVADSVARAELALESADCAELHALFLASRRDHAKLMGVFDTVVQHYAGSKDAPRLQSSDAVEAMRDVALAAIALARDSLGGKARP